MRGLILVYRYFISPLSGPRCRFYPTCSSYAYECYERFGFWQASVKTLRRLLKCHPWHPGGIDKVEEVLMSSFVPGKRCHSHG